MYIYVEKQAMGKAIPKSRHKYVYQLKMTPEIQNLENQFEIVQQNAATNGWTYNNYREYVRIRHELKDKCKERYIKNWENKIGDFANYNKNSKDFWSKFKILKGKNVTHTNSMKDPEGNKYYTDKEKCNLMETTWRDIFRIIDEEEAKFDRQHPEHIDTYINTNSNRVSSFPTSDITRLSDEHFHTRGIEMDEIKACIRRFKKKVPGF